MIYRAMNPSLWEDQRYRSNAKVDEGPVMGAAAILWGASYEAAHKLSHALWLRLILKWMEALEIKFKLHYPEWTGDDDFARLSELKKRAIGLGARASTSQMLSVVDDIQELDGDVEAVINH